MESKTLNKKIASETSNITQNGMRYKYGTIDRVKCTSAFIRLEFWLDYHECGIESQIRQFQKRFRFNLPKLGPIYFEGNDKYILTDYNYPKEHSDDNKKKTKIFISIEFTIILKTQVKYNEDFKFILENFASNLYDIVNTFEINITPTKK